MRKSKKRRSKPSRVSLPRGAANSFFVLIIMIVLVFSVLLAGNSSSLSSPEGIIDTGGGGSEQVVTGGGCCNTGDGAACKPVEGSSITYNGQQYGLLKSNVLSAEEGAHILATGQIAPNGEEIFVNERERPEPNEERRKEGCSSSDKDWYSRKESGITKCYEVPNDEIIFTCSKLNPPNICNNSNWEKKVTAIWDAYFRLADYPSPGIPAFIANCKAPLATVNNKGEVVKTVAAATDAPGDIIFPTKHNLQLETFSVTPAPAVTAVPIVASYITPYCKPAIYLYPETTTPINVRVFAKGPLTVTIPKYPVGGWNVVADPVSNVHYQNKVYPYLYYEAQIPDSLIAKPEEGYVVAAADLSIFLPDLLTKLGLNAKERGEFTEYWVRALPTSPYYKVKIISQKTLDDVASLAIIPNPKTIIRVTLYFEALDVSEFIYAPTITSVARNGFTVVEWGGMFKRDKDHGFSCFM
jgi:hypothetical protein